MGVAVACTMHRLPVYNHPVAGTARLRASRAGVINPRRSPADDTFPASHTSPTVFEPLVLSLCAQATAVSAGWNRCFSEVLARHAETILVGRPRAPDPVGQCGRC